MRAIEAINEVIQSTEEVKRALTAVRDSFEMPTIDGEAPAPAAAPTLQPRFAGHEV